MAHSSADSCHLPATDGDAATPEPSSPALPEARTTASEASVVPVPEPASTPHYFHFSVFARIHLPPIAPVSIHSPTAKQPAAAAAAASKPVPASWALLTQRPECSTPTTKRLKLTSPAHELDTESPLLAASPLAAKRGRPHRMGARRRAF